MSYCFSNFNAFTSCELLCLSEYSPAALISCLQDGIKPHNHRCMIRSFKWKLTKFGCLEKCLLNSQSWPNITFLPNTEAETFNFTYPVFAFCKQLSQKVGEKNYNFLFFLSSFIYSSLFKNTQFWKKYINVFSNLVI